MTEPELPHNFTTSYTEAINDNRACLIAVVALLVEKGFFTHEEFLAAKSKIVTMQDQWKAEADDVYREYVKNLPLSDLIKKLFT